MHQLLRGSLYWGKVISLGIILGVGIQFAEAWTNPSLPAPGGNVAGPLNTGVINQVKNASLGLVGNLAANMLQINGVATEGAVCASTGLVARDTGGVILSCQSGVWAKGMGSTGLITKANYKTIFAGASAGPVGSNTGEWLTIDADGVTGTYKPAYVNASGAKGCTIQSNSVYDGYQYSCFISWGAFGSMTSVPVGVAGVIFEGNDGEGEGEHIVHPTPWN